MLTWFMDSPIYRMNAKKTARNKIKDKWRARGVTDKHTLNRICDKVMKNRGY